jgi:hypothetical protein
MIIFPGKPYGSIPLRLPGQNKTLHKREKAETAGL